MVLPRALNIENQKNFNRALFNVHMTIKFFVCQTHFSTALHWETNSQKLLLEMTTGLFSSPAPKIEKKGSVTSSKTLKVLGFNHLLRLLERLMDSWPVNPWVFFSTTLCRWIRLFILFRFNSWIQGGWCYQQTVWCIIALVLTAYIAPMEHFSKRATCKRKSQLVVIIIVRVIG